MSNKYHVWYYIKDFAIFNTKQNISLPSELVHYIYSYIITHALKQNFNLEYICHNIHEQLIYNERLRDQLRNTKIYPYNEQGYRKNEELLASSNVGNFIYNCKYPHMRETIAFYMNDLPYASLMSIETLYHIIDRFLDFKKYSHKKCIHNNRYFSQTYIDHQKKKSREDVDFLLLKLYSNEESDY